MSSELKNTRISTAQRRRRTRSQIRGTSDRPRLSVYISNKQISAQIIDDTSAKTLVSANSIAIKGTISDKAASVGASIAKAGRAAKIKKVVFDRGDAKYHGRVKDLADAARAGGLEF
jgi:large subunit ribosomal protein L18